MDGFVLLKVGAAAEEEEYLEKPIWVGRDPKSLTDEQLKAVRMGAWWLL